MQGAGETLSLVDRTYPFRSLIPCDLRDFTRRYVPSRSWFLPSMMWQCILYWNPTSYFGHFSQIKEYFLNAYDLGELLFTAIIGNQFCSILQTCQAYAYNFFLPTALLQMSSISTGVPIVFGCLSSSIWHTQPASTLTRWYLLAWLMYV